MSKVYDPVKAGRRWECAVEKGPHVYVFVRWTRGAAQKAAIRWFIDQS